MMKPTWSLLVRGKVKDGIATRHATGVWGKYQKRRYLAFSAKDERNPLKRGGFSCFKDTPIGKAPGWGTGDGGGVVAESSGKSYIERTDNLRIRGEDDALPRMWSLWLQQKYQDP